MRSLSSSGLSMDGAREVLDRLTQGQSVMLATNDILWLVALVFGVAACVIWLAPKPKRAVSMAQGGH